MESISFYNFKIWFNQISIYFLPFKTNFVWKQTDFSYNECYELKLWINKYSVITSKTNFAIKKFE